MTDSTAEQLDDSDQSVQSSDLGVLQEMTSVYKERCEQLFCLSEEISAKLEDSLAGVNQEKAAWQAEKARVVAIQALEPDLTLNVGGHIFSTTLSTLTRFPDTMIGVMFSGRHPLHKNKDGAVTIDRDGTHFRHILNFLRDPVNYSVDHLEATEIIELKREAHYYGLSELMWPSEKTTADKQAIKSRYDI